MELHDKLYKLYGGYEIYNDYLENNKPIIIIQSNDVLVLKGTYVLLGSYSRTKNIWRWADGSIYTDKIITNRTTELRKDIKKYNELQKFASEDQSISTSDEIYNNINMIGTILNCFILTNHSDKSEMTNHPIVHFFMLDKILINNMISSG
jgi:hypothetical protein